MPIKHRLLIVENDSSLLDLLSRNFTKMGYAVTSVCHPRQALEAGSLHAFDVALIDGSLPEHDGIWLMQKLKRLADVQVIILSAYSDRDFKERAMANGAFAYLQKPSGLVELEAAIEQAIEDRAARAETTVSNSDCV